MQKKNIAIVGAGPAGLMAAEILASAGHRVAVYDRMASPARKFLIAGRGGLNLTHSEDLERFLMRYREAEQWLSPAIRAFPPSALRTWCESLGEKTFIGTSGRVFPKKMKAVQLLRAWLLKLESLSVTYHPKHTWEGWEGSALRFATSEGAVKVHADAVVLALGGASWPRLGSDGRWTDILTHAGIGVSPLVPSNCGFVVPWSTHFSERFAGQPLKPVTIHHRGESRRGEAMITAKGIEGGAIYALSVPIRDSIKAEGKAVIHLDLSPNLTVEALAAKLSKRRPDKSLSTFLKGIGMSPVAVGLLRESTPETPADPSVLASLLKLLPVTLRETAGIARAISSGGGIRQSELTETFMLKKKPGVYAIGEMLDWEAPTGGYLLQACFSTAVAAAEAIKSRYA